MDQPQWEHDCDECVFLGTFDFHDLYYCAKGKLTPAVVARFGDAIPDYRIGLPKTGTDIHLREAYFRAKQQGLIQG